MISDKKKLKKNMTLNAIKSVMSIVFPLITFPYVAKVLGVDNIGKYDFSNSIVTYFMLLSALGIDKYAIREGSGLKDDNDAFTLFSNEIFTLNLMTTLVSLIMFFVLSFSNAKLLEYRQILVVLSFQIALKVFGVEWLYSIHEDYKYLTIGSIVFQTISLGLLFIFVKTPESLIMYCILHVISSSGICILSWIKSRKYIRLRIVKLSNWKNHIKPILILFAMDATITIYVTSDKTILGIICGDYTVGLYAVATKVYTIVKSVLAAVLIVSIPQLSYLSSKDESEDFNKVASSILKMLITFLFPAITGMILLRKEIVVLISSIQFIEATKSYILLCLALVFCMLAWFWGQCILIPIKEEMTVFKATLISAVTNIVLNLILIPYYAEIAAAFTTAISQLMAFVICWQGGKKRVNISGVWLEIIKSFIGCIGIIGCSIVLLPFNSYLILYTITMIIMSVTVYLSIEVLIKNEAILDLVEDVISKYRLLRSNIKRD